VTAHPKKGMIAIEVQITQLTATGWRKKIQDLFDAHDVLDNQRYPTIWIYVPSEKFKDAALRAVKQLSKEDQRRIGVGVRSDLLQSMRW